MVEPGLGQIGAALLILVSTIGITFSLQARFADRTAVDLSDPPGARGVRACRLVGPERRGGDTGASAGVPAHRLLAAAPSRRRARCRGGDGGTAGAGILLCRAQSGRRRQLTRFGVAGTVHRSDNDLYLTSVTTSQPPKKSADAAKLSTATRIVRRASEGTPRRVSADICVLGAGIAGVSAALEAARLGRKVALVDGLPALGGQAVNSIIGTFCGLFANGTHGHQLTHGIADDILRDLGAQGALHYRRGGPSNTTVVMYDEIALSRWIEEAIRKADITVLLGAMLRGVGATAAACASSNSRRATATSQLAATGFVDATGDAALTWQAGFACREPADGPVYGTQMIVLENIDEIAATDA